ncbi:MAG: hypothetical protein HYV13_01840 [Candidatus Doudnabacteria bacterium]|nr:hypothetical protein [Candidatus Doudnabacteria bacterium]
MELFDSPFGPVELTSERWSHIVNFHPELRTLKPSIKLVLENPELIRPSKTDPKAFILYREISHNKHLAAVVKINRRNFILTAYLTYWIQS